ncbi:cytosolic carboxypeptidase-like protein 5 isoform X2 [Acanthaster planci]|uniref:Cytosolic carboxypeptidase-like protein 5 n=1 Tax=Acanthaster planci TaxID=133434 RepID=A0A8B7YCW7_ACAPL|nr:cytosolic carboxypeptidase-like protein 5 isoform X2 [Acanthaster planci]
MEYRSGGLLFTSKFDSGNLARVERVYHDDEDDVTIRRVGDPSPTPDYEFNVWTKPDCGGTEFENGNRSWFHFAIKGCPMNKLVKINIMNMNKQGKLYSQGMAPVVRVLPQKPKWERIRERPTYENADGQFILTFTYRFEYRFSSVYFAFCYPYSYLECQQRMDELDTQFTQCQNLSPSSPVNSIYYHRELLCYSLDRLRVDLMTITSCHGLTSEREPRLPKLFPDQSLPRAHKFRGKRVFVLTSRVHPGETPASFVFNGFLEFILRPKDPRAVQLRRQYVFKLIPLLNPDGVQRGHYRTDQRGVNLNRVYLDPDFAVYPSIFAAKSLILHHHMSSRVIASPSPRKADLKPVVGRSEKGEGEGVVAVVAPSVEVQHSPANAIVVVHEGSGEAAELNTECQTDSTMDHLHVKPDRDVVTDNQQGQAELLDTSRLDSNTAAMTAERLDSKSFMESETRSHISSVAKESSVDGDSGGEDDEDRTFQRAPQDGVTKPDPTPAADETGLNISPSESGVALYMDLHGHASKRGCFVYGNHFEDEERHVDNLLFPKLIAMNSAHFDFDGCNFTEKNMYTKDKRDGMSKEGSGRVAVHKATGIIHSYTLECNYNSGRFVNSLSPATMDDGRATPPPLAGYPPKYTPAHFEEVGRAVAVAALDLTNTNPWSRLASTEYSNVMGVRAWVQRYIRSMRGAPSLPKKMARVASKTSSIVASATANALHNRPRFSWSDTATSQTPSGPQNNPVSSSVSATTTTAAKKTATRHLGPVRETKATLERKKHLQQLQGSKLASASIPAFGSTTLRSYPLPNQGRQALPNPTTSHHSSTPQVTAGSTSSLKPHKTSLQSQSSLLQGVPHPHVHGVTNPVTHGMPPPIRHGVTLPGTLKGKPQRPSEDMQSTPNVVHELLSNVMIKALEESMMAQTRGVSKVSCTPGVKVPTNHKMLFRMANNEAVASDDNINPMKQQDSPSSEPTKRRKKPSGLKRRSASHSPTRKGRRTGRGKGSETDSEKEKKQGRRRRKGSMVTSQSDPLTSESVPDLNIGPQNGHDQTPLRRRSSDFASPDIASHRSRLAARFGKSHSLGENPESSVSCQVVDLNSMNSNWKPKKEVSFWM